MRRARAKDILAKVAAEVLDPAAFPPFVPSAPAAEPAERTPEEAAAAWERHRTEEEQETHRDQYADMRQ